MPDEFGSPVVCRFMEFSFSLSVRWINFVNLFSTENRFNAFLLSILQSDRSSRSPSRLIGSPRSILRSLEALDSLNISGLTLIDKKNIEGISQLFDWREFPAYR